MKLNNLFFKEFQRQDELVKYYALASGLYALDSKYAGASYDLIKEGWNGEIF